MSTHFDIACLDCEVESCAVNTFKDENALRSLVDKREKLFSALELSVWPIDVTVRVQGYGVSIKFLKAHHEHRLVVKCEYESFEECAVRYARGQTWRSGR